MALGWYLACMALGKGWVQLVSIMFFCLCLCKNAGQGLSTPMSSLSFFEDNQGGISLGILTCF